MQNIILRGNILSSQASWFAWHPVKVNTKWAWFKTVMCKTTYISGRGIFDIDVVREYSEII